MYTVLHQIKKLKDFGWGDPTKESFGNFQRNWPAQTNKDRSCIASEIIRIFLADYGHLPGEDFEMELQFHS